MPSCSSCTHDSKRRHSTSALQPCTIVGSISCLSCVLLNKISSNRSLINIHRRFVLQAYTRGVCECEGRAEIRALLSHCKELTMEYPWCESSLCRPIAPFLSTCKNMYLLMWGFFNSTINIKNKIFARLMIDELERIGQEEFVVHSRYKPTLP